MHGVWNKPLVFRKRERGEADVCPFAAAVENRTVQYGDLYEGDPLTM